MNSSRPLLFALAMAVPAAAFSQVAPERLRAQSLPQDVRLPFWSEHSLEDKLAPKPREPDLQDFVKLDFHLVRSDLSFETIAHGVTWNPFPDESINLRSRLVLRYEPKYPPTSLWDGFIDKPLFRPVRKFVMDHL